MTGTGPVAVRQPRVRDRDRSDLKGRDQVTTSLLTCARSDPDRHLEGSLMTPLSSG